MGRGKKKLQKLQQQIQDLRSKISGQPTQPNPSGGTVSPRQVVEQLIQTSITRAEQFSGPLPPPQVLDQYNKLVPGFAERIMAMAESQLNHRHDLETTVVKTRSRIESRATHYAFILALVFGAGAFYLILNGYGAAGIALIITEITGLAGVFIVGRVLQRKENQEKLKALAGRPRDS